MRKGQVGQWHQIHEEHVGANSLLEAPFSPSDGLQSLVVGKPHGEAQQQIDTHRVQHRKRHPREHQSTCSIRETEQLLPLLVYSFNGSK